MNVEFCGNYCELLSYLLLPKIMYEANFINYSFINPLIIEVLCNLIKINKLNFRQAYDNVANRERHRKIDFFFSNNVFMKATRMISVYGNDHYICI